MFINFYTLKATVGAVTPHIHRQAGKCEAIFFKAGTVQSWCCCHTILCPMPSDFIFLIIKEWKKWQLLSSVESGAYSGTFLDIYRDFQWHRDTLEDKSNLPLEAVLGSCGCLSKLSSWCLFHLAQKYLPYCFQNTWQGVCVCLWCVSEHNLMKWDACKSNLHDN